MVICCLQLNINHITVLILNIFRDDATINQVISCFSGAKEMVSSSEFGKTDLPTLNERLSCSGGELTLEDCKREDEGLHPCIGKELVAVVCQGKKN